MKKEPPAVSAAGLDDFPLVLEINDNHFYMEKLAGVLDFRLTNRSDALARQVRLVVRDEHFGSPRECSLELPPGQSSRRRIQILPSLSGEHLIELTLWVESEGLIHVYTAELTLKILEKNTSPTNLNISVDQRITGEKIGFGLSYRNETAKQILDGAIKTANDLLQSHYPDSWQPIALQPDIEQTRQLRETRPVQIVPHVSDPGESMEAATLAPANGGCAALLLGMRSIRMGRSRKNDIVLRVLPRTPENDALSLRISGQKPHLLLSLGPEGLMLTDQETANGTELDGVRIKLQTAIPLDRPCEIKVGGALRLKITPFANPPTPSGGVDSYQNLGPADETWRLAERLGLRSVVIDRLDNLAGQEKYILIYRWLTIGHGDECELPAPALCKETRCMRIIRRSGRFWMEGLNDRTCLSADSKPVPHRFARPLACGMKIGCDQAPWTFEKPRQAGF